MELLRREPEPAAQPLAARVVEGHARRMHLAAGRLGRDEDLRGRMHLHHGARPVLEVVGAEPACAQLTQQPIDAAAHAMRSFQ